MVDADPDAVLLVDDSAVVQRLLVHPELMRDNLEQGKFRKGCLCAKQSLLATSLQLVHLLANQSIFNY